MDILWIYISNEAVIFLFPFLWKFGFTKRAKGCCNDIYAKLPFFGFFFSALLFIACCIWLPTSLITTCWFSFSSWKKLGLILSLSSAFSVYSFFSVQIWYYIQCLSAFLISFILISFKSIRRLTHVLICKVNKPS